MDNSDTADADRASIRRTAAGLLSAVNASDVDGCVALWARDGVLMPPHHPPVHGHTAIAEFFRDLFARNRFTFTFTSSHIDLAGDVALERVTYTAIIRPGPGASPITDAGKGLHVYARQRDGSWKLAQDIWNSDRPL